MQLDRMTLGRTAREMVGYYNDSYRRRDNVLESVCRKRLLSGDGIWRFCGISEYFQASNGTLEM